MILEAIGRGVTKAPAAVIVVILVVTGILGAFASQTSMESTEEDFSPDTEIALASERVSEYFGAGVNTVQVIARSPDGATGDVLTRDGLLKLLSFEEAIIDPEPGARNVTATIAPTSTVPTGVQSIADIIAFGAMVQGGAEEFRAGMEEMAGGLGLMNESIGGLAYSLSLMNASDPNSTGTTLVTIEASLDGIVTNLMQMAGGGQGSGNGGLTSMPDLDTVRGILEGMDDSGVKGTIKGMYAFDATPYEQAAEAAGSSVSALQESVNTSTGPLGSSLSALMMDPSFMALNHTFNGTQVNASQLIADSLTSLFTIDIALANIDGFENTPELLENVMGGLSAGLFMVLSMDFDPSSPAPAAKASLMIVQQNASLDSDTLKDAQYDIEELAEDIQETNGGGVELRVVGNEILFDKINTSSMDSLNMLLALAIVFIIVILFLVYRSLSDTGLTLLALMFVITWTFGLGTLLGFEFNPLTTAVPILLVGLSVDYGIHLTMRYRVEKRTKSLRDAGMITVASVGMALLLATVTTVFSFMSNIISSLSVMRQFGILTAIGIIAAFIIMNTFVPAVRVWLDLKREAKGKRKAQRAPGESSKGAADRALARFIQLGANAASRFAPLVIVLSVVLSGVSFYTLTEIDTEFDFLDFLPDDLPETETIVYLTEEFNFSASSSAVLLEGDVAKSEVFIAMDQAQRAMDDDADVVKRAGTAEVTSPLSVIQRYCLPVSPDYVPQLGALFLLADTDSDGVPDPEGDVTGILEAMMANPVTATDLAGVLHRDDSGRFDAAVVRVRVIEQTDGGERLNSELLDDIEPLEDLEGSGDLDGVILTGGPVLTYNIVSEMNTAGLESVLATIIAAAILLTIAFYVTYRTFAVGLLTVIPIILVIGWVFGAMFVLDVPLNVVTITVAALTVGLGITYAIHISHRFLEDVQKEPWERAMCTTVGHTGAALFGAAATTIGGFGLLAFSLLPPLAQFGIVTGLSILFSFLASVFVLPSFLAIWARWKFGSSPEGLTRDAGIGPEGEGEEAADDGEAAAGPTEGTEEADREA